MGGGGIHVQLPYTVINVWRINMWRGHSRVSQDRHRGTVLFNYSCMNQYELILNLTRVDLWVMS